MFWLSEFVWSKLVCVDDGLGAGGRRSDPARNIREALFVPGSDYFARVLAGQAATCRWTRSGSRYGRVRIIENVTGAPLTGTPPITDPEQVSIVGHAPTRLSVV
jgi:hypothetical protein